MNTNDLENLQNIFKECFDIEYSKLPDKEKLYVTNAVGKIYFQFKLHTLFNAKSLLMISTSVFEEPASRDFILCLTDRLGIALNLGESNTGSESPSFPIQRMLASGICNKNDGEVDEFSLMPEAIKNNLEIDFGKVFKTLQYNKWLVTVILINLYLHTTAVIDLGSVPVETVKNRQTVINNSI